MTDSDTRTAKHTKAVTAIGALILLAGVAGCVAGTMMLAANPGNISADPAPAFLFPIFLLFAFVGLAMLCRWRGWRVWSGILAWGLIAVAILGLFAEPDGSSRALDLTFRSVVIAVASIILIAKRGERSPSIPGA